jgi:glycosyltransferase involved in cell wall biosynthesis
LTDVTKSIQINNKKELFGSMIIIFNSHYLKREITGLGRYTRQLHAALSKHDVINIHPVSILYKNKYLRFISIFLYELLGPFLIRLKHKNAIHISPAFSCAAFAKAADIVVMHDLAFLEYPEKYTKVEKLYFRFNCYLLSKSPCKIVTPSMYVKSQLINNLGIKETRIHQISPYSEFSGSNRDENNYFILLSNAHPRKNISNVVNAFSCSDAAACGFRLIVVGNFDYTVNDGKSNLEFIKGLDDDNLQSLLSHSSALLLFSYSEGFGYPVIEAASLGVPSLTSNVTSLNELMIDVDGNKPCLTVVEIETKINMFLHDNEYRKQLKNHTKILNNRYSKSIFVAKWRKLLDE